MGCISLKLNIYTKGNVLGSAAHVGKIDLIAAKYLTKARINLLNRRNHKSTSDHLFSTIASIDLYGNSTNDIPSNEIVYLLNATKR